MLITWVSVAIWKKLALFSVEFASLLVFKTELKSVNLSARSEELKVPCIDMEQSTNRSAPNAKDGYHFFMCGKFCFTKNGKQCTTIGVQTLPFCSCKS